MTTFLDDAVPRLRPRRILALLLLAAAVPGAARSDDLAAAKKSFDEGKARFEQGDFKGAVDSFTKAIASNPRFGYAYQWRANANYKLKQFKLEIPDLDKAIELIPEDAALYNNRGFAKMQTGDLAGAVSDLSHALAINPAYETALKNRVVAYGKLGRQKDAEADQRTLKELEVNRGAPATASPGPKPAPATAAATPRPAPPAAGGAKKETVVSYGKPEELRGLTAYWVVVAGGEITIRNALVEYVQKKLPQLTLLDSSDKIDEKTMILSFYGLEGQKGDRFDILLLRPNEKRMLDSFRPDVRQSLESQAKDAAKEFVKVYKKANGL